MILSHHVTVPPHFHHHHWFHQVSRAHLLRWCCTALPLRPCHSLPLTLRHCLGSLQYRSPDFTFDLQAMVSPRPVSSSARPSLCAPSAPPWLDIAWAPPGSLVLPAPPWSLVLHWTSRPSAAPQPFTPSAPPGSSFFLVSPCSARPYLRLSHPTWRCPL